MIKYILKLCLVALLSPAAAAAASVFGELHSAYELAQSIWRDLQRSQARETGLPAGLHVYASQTRARVVRTSRGDAIVCHSGPCTWVVLFYHLENSCQGPVFFNPAKLQIEVFDRARNAITLDNVSAFVSRLEIYPFYKWQEGGRVQLTQMKDLKSVLRDAPVFRDMTGAAWVGAGSVSNGYNVYAARQLDSMRIWQLKYREHFTSDTAYIERGERHIGNCPIYFHPQ